MIEFLHWDTDFFGWKTGCILTDDFSTLETQLLRAKSNGYRLVYLFTRDNNFISKDICDKFNGFLVDQKVIFTMSDLLSSNCQSVSEYYKEEADSDLVSLALISGKFSRFKLDSHFVSGEFEKMYLQWIESSVQKKSADKIFVTKDEDKTTSMVTVKLEQHVAKIGLIATDPLYQGRGFGKQLIDKVKNFAIISGCQTIQVPTQQANTQACSFYISCGFTKKSTSLIYHFWL